MILLEQMHLFLIQREYGVEYKNDEKPNIKVFYGIVRFTSKCNNAKKKH